MSPAWLILLCAALVLPAQANTLIQQARETGALDAETALLYQVYAVLGDESLPAQYRETPAQPFCATPELVEAHTQLTSASARARLATILQRPSSSRDLLTPSGHFRIHYDLAGIDAIDGTDRDGNRVPDYVETVASTLDRVWKLEIDELGYNPPPSDGGLGGGEEYDVFLVQLASSGAYGYTISEQGEAVSPSYITLDNDYTDSIYKTPGLSGLQATAAHEFFHAIQFGYYQGSDGVWWQEGSATWMEEVAYPEANDYLHYLSDFLQQPERALDSGSAFSRDVHIYGATLFAHFLDQRYSRGLIRVIWEELGRRASANLEYFDDAIHHEVAGGLAEAMGGFAVWNYFTGSRYRLPSRYPDGDQYPQVPRLHLHPLAKVVVQDSGAVDHLGSAYVTLAPRLQPGGVVLEVQTLRGQWRRQVLLISRDSVEVRSFGGGQLLLAGWDRYDEVVLVLAETDQGGSGYEYRVSAQYDPDLIDEPAPVVSLLRQSYPNPFQLGRQISISIPFELSQPSQQTRLSIFAADGQPVREMYLGVRAARPYREVWDGRNQAGKLVESGIYYYVLEADGFRAAKTLAVVRE